MQCDGENSSGAAQGHFAADLAEAEAAAVMNEILRGESTPGLTAALLAALRMKGETVDEIAGFARAMRANAVAVRPAKTAPQALVDTCGTGGDGGATFNISTAAAFVAAGAGAAVAKHGNRSVSSRCGSADVLEACGVNVSIASARAAECIDAIGVGFLFAPAMHPAMKHAGPVRKELGMRTVFNILGPLTNPAGAGAQVMGVFADSLVEPAAQVLGRLGVKRAFVVHGSDGLDEITTTGPTKLAEVCGGAVSVREVTPTTSGSPGQPRRICPGAAARPMPRRCKRFFRAKKAPGAISCWRTPPPRWSLPGGPPTSAAARRGRLRRSTPARRPASWMR